MLSRMLIHNALHPLSFTFSGPPSHGAHISSKYSSTALAPGSASASALHASHPDVLVWAAHPCKSSHTTETKAESEEFRWTKSQLR